MSQREELWDEIYDLPIFHEAHPDRDWAWHWAEQLKNGGKLRQADLLSLKALLECAQSFDPNAEYGDERDVKDPKPVLDRVSGQIRS